MDEALERVRALAEKCRHEQATSTLPEDLATAVEAVRRAVEQDAREIIGSARREAWEVLSEARGELAVLAFEIRAKRGLRDDGGAAAGDDSPAGAVSGSRQFVTHLTERSASAFRRSLRALGGWSHAAVQTPARSASSRSLGPAILQRWRTVSVPLVVTFACAIPLIALAAVMWSRVPPPRAETPPVEVPLPSLGTGGVASVESPDPASSAGTEHATRTTARADTAPPAAKPGPVPAVTSPPPTALPRASALEDAAGNRAETGTPPPLKAAPSPDLAPVPNLAAGSTATPAPDTLPVFNPAPVSNPPPVSNPVPVSNTALASNPVPASNPAPLPNTPPVSNTAPVAISAPGADMAPAPNEPASTTPPRPASTRDMLLARDGEWFDAHYRGDRSALLQLSLPAFEFVDERPATERPVVKNAAPVRSVRDVRVDEFGDSALLTGRMLEHVPDGGRDFESLLSEVWIRHEGEWRLISVRLASPKTVGGTPGR